MRDLRRALVLAALLAACAEPGAVQEEPDGGTPVEADAGETIFPCEITADCPIGYTCVGGESKVGACQFGQELCVNGQWRGVCVGAILPVSSEVCDNKDDDCDGFIDEDYDKQNDNQHCG